MINSGIYKVGLSLNEVSREALEKSGLKFSLVSPREQFVSSARSVTGKLYKRGASVLKDAPEYFDCSSLVAWCAVQAGFSIPRISIDQYVYSERINKEDLKPGDLIFINTKQIIHTDGSYFSQVLGREVKEEAIRTETLEFRPGTKVPQGVDHVGIYTGDGHVIHASGKMGKVVEEKLNQNNAFENIVGCGRIINDETKRFVIEIPDTRIELREKENLIKELAVSTA
ncbi:MAG: C40 family peptidase [Minisyncoccota bacterium]